MIEFNAGNGRRKTMHAKKRGADTLLRGAILTLLAQNGAGRVTALAKHFDMSLNAVSKHIKVLTFIGGKNRSGQVHFEALRLSPFISQCTC